MEDPKAVLKVVIHLTEGHASVGVVEGTGKDPFMEAMPAGSLEEVLQAVPGVVGRARERWASSPRNPAYQGPPLPAPAPVAPVPARTPVPARPAQRRMETPRLI